MPSNRLSRMTFLVLQDLGISLTEEELEDLITELDKDGDGEINYR